MKMLRAAPALPVQNVAESVAFYATELGFTTVHEEEGFAILQYDTVKSRTTCETIKAGGVAFPVPLSTEPWGKWAQFADPDGNEFGIWAPADEDA